MLKSDKDTKVLSVRCMNHSIINKRSYCLPPYGTPAHDVLTYHSVSGQSLAVNFEALAVSASQKDPK